MPPFVDDAARYPNELRLIRILRDAGWWYPQHAPTRASSCAFSDTTKQNSCLVLNLLERVHFEIIATTYPGARLSMITAGQARETGYLVCDDPSDFLPGHVVVCPPQATEKKDYVRMAKRLAALSVIYTPIL